MTDDHGGLRRRRLNENQLAFVRGRPLYPLAVWTLRAEAAFMILAIGGSIVRAHGFALSLFCAFLTLAPVMLAAVNIIARQLEQVVLGSGENGHWLRVACVRSLRADAFSLRGGPASWR